MDLLSHKKKLLVKIFFPCQETKIELLFELVFTSTFAFAKDTADVRVFYLVM